MVERGPEQTAAEQAERAIAGIFVAARVGELAFSALMVAGDRRRYSRPKLQTALLAAAAVESAWLARRLLKAGCYRDRTALWVDTAWSAAGLVVCGAGLGPGEAAPWMKNMAIGAALGASSSEVPAERAGAMGLLGAAAAVAGLRAEGRDSHVAGLALGINDIISWTGSHIAVSTYIAAHRRQARLQDEADGLALEQATEAAAEAERSHQHQLVHQRTMEVLRDLAGSADQRSAGALARQEAGRLRHILRTKGEVPTDLDRALYDLAQAAGADGFRVELVTAELNATGATVAAEAIAPVREAVHVSLLAAKEFAGADRAVVRAASQPEGVTVTIRHHAGGFDPGAGSSYERRLAELDRVLAPVGGAADVWSAPDRGVRVTVVVPVAASESTPSNGERARHEAAERLPDRRVGGGPAGDDHRPVDERDVDRRSVRRLVGGAQDEVDRLEIVADRDVGAGSEAFEPGAQQGPAGDDAHGRGPVHGSTMAQRTAPVLVRSTPFPADAAAHRPAHGPAWHDEATRADKTIASLFMSWRWSGLATGLAATVAGRKRYRSQAAAGVQLAAAALESAWLARRFAHNGYRFDGAVRVVEPAAAISVLLAARSNLEPGDRWTWINWAPWSYAINVASGRGIDEEHPAVNGLAALAVVGAGAALADRWTDRIVNSVGMGACFAGGHVFAGQIRNGAARLEAARSDAIDEGRRLAGEQERSRQLRLLHDSALQTLEAVGSGRYADLASVQALAHDEANRLEDELAGALRSTRTLREEIAVVVDEQTRHGMQIDLQVHAGAEPSARVVLALRDACNEALVNVKKHAGTGSAGVVVEPANGGMRVTVHDEGVGFDPSLGVGFGTTQSIAERMAEVAGRAEIDSAPGRGTRVSLWGPT